MSLHNEMDSVELRKIMIETTKAMFELPVILAKVEMMEPLTEEEKSIFFKYIKNLAVELKDISKGPEIKGTIKTFKFASLVGRFGGKKTATFVRKSRVLGNLSKDMVMTSTEILKGVKITSNNITSGNHLTLLQQRNATFDYLYKVKNVLGEVDASLKASNQNVISLIDENRPDYIPLFSDATEKSLEQAKRKVKAFRDQYQINKGRK